MEVSESRRGVILREEELEVSEICGDEPMEGDSFINNLIGPTRISQVCSEPILCSLLTQGATALLGQTVRLVVASIVQLVVAHVVQGDRPGMKVESSVGPSSGSDGPEISSQLWVEI